jgi:hypothetical protein
MLQVRERPFTATSTARRPKSTPTILGVSAKYSAMNSVIKTRPSMATATGSHSSALKIPRLSIP